jgi:hypothetical protein
MHACSLKKKKQQQKNKKLSTLLVPVELSFMCFMMSLNYFLNVGTWARTHVLSLTCPPPNPLGYYVELIMKKKYQSYYQNYRFCTIS